MRQGLHIKDEPHETSIVGMCEDQSLAVGFIRSGVLSGTEEEASCNAF